MLLLPFDLPLQIEQELNLAPAHQANETRDGDITADREQDQVHLGHCLISFRLLD